MPLTSLDIGLPIDKLRALIGNAFVDTDSSGQITMDAVNRRGRRTPIRMTCTPFRSGEGVGGALLLMEVLG